MNQLPAEIILYIFSLLAVDDLVQLLKWSKSDQLKMYCKSILLNQIKAQAWRLDLYTASDYFALLCNRDFAVRPPVIQLFCISFNAHSLVFETHQCSSLLQGLRVYCPYWIHLFREDDQQGELDLMNLSEDKIMIRKEQTKLQLIVSFNWFIQRMGIQLS